MFINEAPGVYDVKKAEVLMEIFQLPWLWRPNPFPRDTGASEKNSHFKILINAPVGEGHIDERQLIGGEGDNIQHEVDSSNIKQTPSLRVASLTPRQHFPLHFLQFVCLRAVVLFLRLVLRRSVILVEGLEEESVLKIRTETTDRLVDTRLEPAYY